MLSVKLDNVHFRVMIILKHFSLHFKLLIFQLPWISEFIVESGWAQEIIMNLTKVRRGGLDMGVKAAFDDLLSSLIVSGGPEVMEEFKKCGVIQVCQTHMLKELARAIAASAMKNSKK